MLLYTYYKIIYKLLFISYKSITILRCLKPQKGQKRGTPNVPNLARVFFKNFQKKVKNCQKKGLTKYFVIQLGKTAFSHHRKDMGFLTFSQKGVQKMWPPDSDTVFFHFLKY